VGGYAKYRVRKRAKKQFRGKGLLLCLALFAGAAWLAWTKEWLPSLRRHLPPLTNVLVAPKANHVQGVQAAAPPTAIVPTPSIALPRIAASVTPAAITNPPPPSPKPRNVEAAKPTAIMEAQIALDRIALSPGSIDGFSGSQTRAAIRAFQAQQGLPITGQLDDATRAQLPLVSAPLLHCRIELNDITRLLPVPAGWLAKSEQPRLDYETLLELMAERSHAHPNLIRKLNPQLDWSAMTPGTLVQVPAATRVDPVTKAAFVLIRLGERSLQAFDAEERLMAHFPCSIAARVEKRPVGELRVVVVVPNPDYLFKPENFPESTEAQVIGRKLRINPGPNNPVGTAWIGLNLPGYGIHGTPRPEEVGRTESHGCFRLANWNAEYLARLVAVGTPVFIEP
jgi:lipoprotein-anchoring transpeptidase ErfK/SrfK